MVKQYQKLDLAARAAWLYYVGGQTQDEIAAQLQVSRPGAQRLIALARESGLIKVNIDHPVADCMLLSQEMRRRFDLSVCEVVPTHGDAASGDIRCLAVAGALILESFIARDNPTVLALGRGRTLRAAVEAMSGLSRPQHSFVSLVGNVARDGSFNPFDAVMVLADKTGGRRFLLPAPMVTDSARERDQFLHPRIYRIVRELADSAEASFVGIGEIDCNAQLYQDGFITDADLDDLMQRGAVGEVLGWALDGEGALVQSVVSDRVTSVPLHRPPCRPFIALAGGRAKAAAIRATLKGGWLTGLVTDEAAARAVLSDVDPGEG